MKICITCSSGGHLTQALAVLEAFEGEDYFLVVHNFPSIKKSKFEGYGFSKVYRLRVLFNYNLPLKILPKFKLLLGCYITIFFNIFEIIFIFLKERPDIIFSTGAEIAIPMFYLGKILFKTKLIFLESLTRIEDISGTGKVVMPIADLFLVQWLTLKEKYKNQNKILYKGSLV